MKAISVAVLFLLFLAMLSPASPAPSLADQLEVIRKKYDLPALAGGIFTVDGIEQMAAVGVRKRGGGIPVTNADEWHLGSNTKAMTAALVGTFVAEGRLHWDDAVISFFPELAAKVAPSTRRMTIGYLLKHQAGLAENLDWTSFSGKGAITDQRRAAVEMALLHPAFPVGSFHYSNTDYVVIGAILDRVGGRPWEELMRSRIFLPLGMASAGFGGTGTPGKIDEPWPHDEHGIANATNGAAADLPLILESAGGVHSSLGDWSRFLVDQLRGGAGLKALLPAAIYSAMQPPPPAGTESLVVGYGWGVMVRDWAGGKALAHDGSNGENYSVAWLAPGRHFGVMVCTNQGGDAASHAVEDAAYMMIQRHLAAPGARDRR